jgi:NAD(P)H-binding
MRYVLKPVGRRFLKHVFSDFVAMEKIVRASGLDWTIVRPPRLRTSRSPVATGLGAI